MLEVLRRAAQMQPQDPIVRFQLGQAYEAMGWFAQAVQEYQEAVHLDPQGASFLKALGHLQLAQGQVDTAATHLERAILADPADADAHFQLATSLERTNSWERAWEEYRAAAQLDVEHPTYWLAVGRTGRILGRWNESLAALRTTLTLEPSSLQADQARLELAQLRADQGAYAEALAACTQALHHNPGSAQAHLLAGRFCRALGRGKEARHHLEAALRTDANSAESHEELGLVLEELGEYTEALSEQQAAAGLAPQRLTPWVHSARIASSLGQQGEAESWLQQALALSPDDPSLHLNMAQLRAKLSAWRDVLRHAEHALTIAPQSREGLLVSISAHLELGNLEEAATLLSGLREQEAENAAWWTLWGRVLEQRQQWDGAKEAYRKALALGADVSVRPRLAALHTQLGEYWEATLQLEQGLNQLTGLTPVEQGRWHLNLADAYRAMGKRDPAREQYHAARASGLEAEAHLGLGRLYLDEGQPKAALDELAQAGQQGLMDARWHHVMALTNQGLGDLTAALESAQQAVVLSPHEVQLWHHLGTLHHKQGNLASAQQALTEALQLDPRHSASWAGMATVFDEQGKPQDALEAYQKAVALAPQENAHRMHLGQLLLRLGRASEAVTALEPAIRETRPA
jgi:tetratricopeptide (TPR) repeat protein